MASSRSTEAEVPGDSDRRILEIGGKRLAGDGLVGLDVAARRLDAHLVRARGDRTVALEALPREPAPHVLLVERLWILSTSEALLVRAREPEARRVGRVDLVDHHDVALPVLAELVLRVDQDEAAPRAPALPVREQA